MSGPADCGRPRKLNLLDGAGVTVVATATGMAQTTISRGMRELELIAEGDLGPAPIERVRQVGRRAQATRPE